MTDSINNIVTLSPIRIHLALRTGVNEKTPGYEEFLEDLTEYQGVLSVPALQRQKVRYESIEDDVYDIRLMRWQFEDNETGTTAEFHVFPNSVAVVEIRIPSIDYHDPATLEDDVQRLSRGIIRRGYERLYAILEKISSEHNGTIVRAITDIEMAPYHKDKGPHIEWVARTLVFNPRELENPSRKELIKAWLSETANPEDADEILAGTKEYSMTWLNYLLIEDAHGSQQFLIDTMVLAQFYYAAQDLSNDQLKFAISSAYLKDSINDVDKKLSETRASARLLEIMFHEHLKHLTRPRRKVLDEILESWDFDDMVKNNQRMVTVCSAKLQEANNQKRERSSSLTELLLAPLSFFAVFELSLFLTQFSREMMTQPALDYKDEARSVFLSTVAEFDADIMIIVGILLSLGLFAAYYQIKKH